MRFDPKSFVDVAELIRDSACTDEKCMRSIINRHYYACFGTARDLMKIFVKDMSVHKVVIETMKRDPSEYIAKAGHQLETLLRFRKEADYNYKTPLIKNTLTVAVATSKSFFNLIEAYRSEDSAVRN